MIRPGPTLTIRHPHSEFRNHWITLSARAASFASRRSRGAALRLGRYPSKERVSRRRALEKILCDGTCGLVAPLSLCYSDRCGLLSNSEQTRQNHVYSSLISFSAWVSTLSGIARPLPPYDASIHAFSIRGQRKIIRSYSEHEQCHDRVIDHHRKTL